MAASLKVKIILTESESECTTISVNLEYAINQPTGTVLHCYGFAFIKDEIRNLICEVRKYTF